MMRKWIKGLVGALVLTVFMGFSVSAAATDFPASDEQGKITIHSFDVSSFENLKGSTGEKVDENNLPNDAKRLSDVTFTLQRLEDSDGNPVSVNTPVDKTFAKQEGMTDSNGELVFSNLPKGYYLISEEIPSGYNAQKSSFVVMLPMKTTNAGGSESWNYDVHVYPKNMSGARITKEADSVKVVGAGDEVAWNIDYEVGEDIKMETGSGTVYARDFYITDTMDSRLTYVDGSTVFRVYDRNQNPVNLDLVKGVDYTEVYNETTNTVTWFYTEAGVQTLADNEIGLIKVSLKTLVNQSAIGTVEVVWNNAAIDFVNASGDPYHLDVFSPDSDKNGADVPKVYLGSIAIDKYQLGQAEKKLANVSFKVAATQDDAKAGRFIQVDEGKDYEGTTDEKGYAIFTALGSGDYWLVETKTAKGYNLLDQPVKVTIGSEPDEANVKVSIANEKSSDGKGGGIGGGKSPQTGDNTNLIYPIAAMGMAVLIAFILWKKKQTNSKKTGKRYEN